MQVAALLATEEGSVFRGQSIGVSGCATGEVVFNTSSTGYQEILTDPSYCQQFICFTHTHIGNVGVNADDMESAAVFANALIIKELSAVTTGWRAEQSFAAWLCQKGVIAIAGIDTRKLTRIIREQGALKACIIAGEGIDEAKAMTLAAEFPGLKGMDLAKKVTCAQPYEFSTPTWYQQQNPVDSQGDKPHLLVMDFGVKRSILMNCVDKGMRVSVVPADTSVETIKAMAPNGILLSNGPGDPEPCSYAIASIQQLLQEDYPILGICLGHQLLAIALGAKTKKMKFGHHGGNHPVQDTKSKKVLITSQNHGFTVEENSLPAEVVVTHRSLFDQTIQGIRLPDKAVFGFQGHPEAGPGPLDALPVFDEFVAAVCAFAAASNCSPV